MASTQLYNESGSKIYPRAESEGTSYNNTTVKSTLDDLISRVITLEKRASGADQVQGDLDVKITYLRTDSDKEPNKDDSSWDQYMQLPDNDHPYLWKKTIFLWKSTEVLTKIEIVTTSLYPQTQYMYTAHKPTTISLGGPTDYQDGISDTIDSNHKWYTTPQSVSSSQPEAYMSIRTRDAGKQWSAWSTPAMYGSYAFDSIPDIRYYVCSSSTCYNKDPNILCDKSTGQLSDEDWKKSISSYSSGTYYLFQTHGVRVNTQYQKVYEGNFWAPPTLISIITIP